MKGEYLFKYHMLYPIKETLKMNKKQINKLHKISSKYCNRFNKCNNRDCIQVYIHMFLFRLNRNYPNVKTFKRQMNQLIYDYNFINDVGYDEDIWLKTKYGVRNKDLVRHIIKHYG